MSKEQEYRYNAAQTVKLARRASSATDKGRLLALAEAWLELIDRHRDARNHAFAARKFFLIESAEQRHPEV